MVRIPVKVIRLLTETGTKNSEMYREIMKLISLFGYASIEEIKYRFGLTEREAINRLWYLSKGTGLIKKFPSGTVPVNFYCLSPLGRDIVKQFNISDFISDFVPSKYSLMYQHHHRLLIKVWSTLQNTWGSKLTNWIAEEHLKREQTKKGSRVLDAEFFLKFYKLYYEKDEVTGRQHDTGKVEEDIMRCGLELEISLKSPRRYRKQVEDLSSYLAECNFSKRPYTRIFYIYATHTIKDRLKQHHDKKYFGDTKIIFVGLDDLFNRKGETGVEGLKTEQKRLIKDLIDIRLLIEKK